MAIHFKAVRYKNFLSSGNYWTEIPLDKSKTTLIVGKNGAGKSTMLDAICFTLYGKPFRKVNKSQLVNTINEKGLLAEIEFSVGKDEYKVVRGIKPNKFEIWKGEEMVSQNAAARDYQELLEENILGMNIKTFGQIVVLGSASFVPFMQLSRQARREVIEDLLDIQIFSSMNNLLKDKVSENKSDIKDAEHNSILLKERLSAAKSQSESIKKIREEEAKKVLVKLEALKDEFLELKDQIDQKKVELSDVEFDSTELESVEDKLLKLQRMETQIKTKLESKEIEQRKLDDHSVCPTCNQDIPEDHKQTHRAKYDIVLSELTVGLEKLFDKIAETKKEVSSILEKKSLHTEVESELTTLKMKWNVLRKSGAALEKEYKEAKDEAKKASVSVDTTEIKEKLGRNEDELAALHLEKEINTVAAAILKDNGIKSRIIDQYVPVINRQINTFLDRMSFFVHFHLDENFEETIKSRHRDTFSYASFSEGEKLRIDLAILFTWRAVSRMRNSLSTNLLIMDEIMDSSLDDDGLDEFLEIIKELTSDSNVFIISHKGEHLNDKFNEVLTFKKVKNFSHMETYSD